MASELTESFAKSRNRLIYFCGIGILLLHFPIDEKSSLFGIRFQNLGPESVNTIFLIIASILFLELVVRMFEERPALIGEHANILKRLTQHRLYTKQISSDLQELVGQFKEHERIQRKTNEEISSQIINATKEIDKSVRMANAEYRPSRTNSIFGQFRIWVEYFSGFLVFTVYVIFWKQIAL